TDNKGRVVNFKNTIIIMTSNLGASIIQENFHAINEKNLLGVLETTKLEVFNLLKKTIRPEFLNRIDDIIMFKPLMKRHIREIVKIQIELLNKLLKPNHLHLSLTEKALDHIAEIGFDPEFGARPIKRLIQKNVLNELSKQILANKVSQGGELELDVTSAGQFVFTNKSIDPILN
ncbi:AAA domain-containing protein, partial [bacterium]|nr:AAA domain-containing protein [bacterium]